jgi:hypothetical protein
LGAISYGFGQASNDRIPRVIIGEGIEGKKGAVLAFALFTADQVRDVPPADDVFFTEADASLERPAVCCAIGYAHMSSLC